MISIILSMKDFIDIWKLNGKEIIKHFGLNGTVLYDAILDGIVGVLSKY